MVLSIQAKKRAANMAAALRSSGQIPGIVYGPEMKPESIVVEYQTFHQLYQQGGQSSLVDLTIEGASTPSKVLVQEVQYDPVSGRMVHVDFRQINMNKEMTAAIEVEFSGESPAVKALGGTLIKGPTVINIRCLPKDLVSHITIDLARLNTFEDMIRISDVAFPAGITVMDQVETVLAKVAVPLTEDQLKAMEESGPKGVDEVEVAKKEKKTEDAEAGTEAKAGAAGEKAAAPGAKAKKA